MTKRPIGLRVLLWILLAVFFLLFVREAGVLMKAWQTRHTYPTAR